MQTPFGIVDGDGHVTESEDQIRPYMDEPYRSRGGQIRAGHNYWDINLGGRLGSVAKDAQTWLDAMDEGGMETAILYPTSIGFTAALIWEPDVAVAVCRAYNDFLHEEFTSVSPRLKSVALLPLQAQSVCCYVWYHSRVKTLHRQMWKQWSLSWFLCVHSYPLPLYRCISST